MLAERKEDIALMVVVVAGGAEVLKEEKGTGNEDQGAEVMTGL